MFGVGKWCMGVWSQALMAWPKGVQELLHEGEAALCRRVPRVHSRQAMASSPLPRARTR